MTWFKTNDASVSNGGTVVTIGDGANTSVVKAGDALIIGSFQPVEVKAVFSGQIELVGAWPNSTQSGQAATAMPTSGDFKSATEALRNATKITQDNYKVIQDWGKEAGTVTFVDYEGNEYETKTMQEMENVFDASLAEREAAYDSLLATSHPHWRTEADMNAMRVQNGDKFAASGFVHFGTVADTSSAVSINEGLYQYISSTAGFNNALRFGNAQNEPRGSSKAAAPVLNIAGFITDFSDIRFNQDTLDNLGLVKFPEAPDGTVTYNTETGEVIDYKTHLDPKYGDVAPDLNEAVARAFEGVFVNSDGRNGVGDGTSSGGGIGWRYSSAGVSFDAATNTWDLQEQSGVDTTVLNEGFQVEADKYYKVTLEVVSTSTGISSNVRFRANSVLYSEASGFTTRDHYIGTSKAGDVVTAIYKATAQGSPYVSVLVSGTDVQFSFKNLRMVECDANGNEIIEVVTDREDMWGFEGWLEEITASNPFVYDRGLPQSQASDIDGVATTDSNRPDSYYAVYDGDTTSRGKGVDFLSLSVLEQDAIALNPANHIYRLADGRLVQWRVRQRTIAGAGNGGWTATNSEVDAYLGFSSRSVSWVTPQGHRDDAPATSATNRKYVDIDDGSHRGIFKQNSGDNDYYGIGGQCFFLVCGTLSRLNQGACHPTYNPNGSTLFLTDTGDGLTSGSQKWHNPLVVNPTNTSDCFQYESSLGVPFNGRSKVSSVRGQISSGATGRDDQYEYYDAIYAGQVNDMRLSAWGIKDTSAAREDAIRKAVRGDMRGKGKVPFLTKMVANTAGGRVLWNGTDAWAVGELFGVYTSTSATADTVTNIAFRDATEGSYTYSVLASNGEWMRVLVTANAQGDDVNRGEIVAISANFGSAVRLSDGESDDYYCPADGVELFFDNTNFLSAEYDSLPWVDIIGDPERIAATFPDGVVGQWIPQDVATATEYNLSVKALTTSAVNTRTTDDGGTWTSSAVALDAVTNTYAWTTTANHVGLIHYEALSDFTEAADNSKVVGEVGGVHTTMHFDPERGNRLMPSLTGEIGKYNSSWPAADTMSTLSYYIESDGSDQGALTNASVPPTHAPLRLNATVNDSHAVKALYTLTEKDGQVFLQFHGSELIHNGTDWGDNAEIPVVDGDSTQTDLNGNTVKTFCHHSMKPIGWVKNEY